MKDNYTWEKFEETWMDQFRDVISAIRLVKQYPERLHLVYLGNLLNHEELFSNQKEWVRLYNKFHPIERGYYKPYHVPINSDDFKTFIDLSKEGYPVFELIYNATSHKWFQMNRFTSMIELIEFLDSDINEPPVWDKELAATIDAKIAELDINFDELLRNYQNRNKDNPS